MTFKTLIAASALVLSLPLAAQAQIGRAHV